MSDPVADGQVLPRGESLELYVGSHKVLILHGAVGVVVEVEPLFPGGTTASCWVPFEVEQ